MIPSLNNVHGTLTSFACSQLSDKTDILNVGNLKYIDKKSYLEIHF